MNEPSLPGRLIETDRFPFEAISKLAERESWRKEVYRPIYHVHKWWAKRLGSVFRGAILGCMLKEDDDLLASFYESPENGRTVVFDPFMGSGTTVGEAHKLGCVALGRDINPVAAEAVRVAFSTMDERDLKNTLKRLSATVGEKIRELYVEPDGSDVLYYFWVKYLECPECKERIDLLNTQIVARNAYPKRKPEVQLLCPGCGDIFSGLITDEKSSCPSCSLEFDPHKGNVAGAKASCRNGHTFSILSVVRMLPGPPLQRIYGKLVLTPEGQKVYRAATEADRLRFVEAERRLESEVEVGSLRLPSGVLADGHNTRQAISYNYKEWRQFFNARQLLALGWLHEEICRLPEGQTRDVFLTLFSGLLEFNNVFASYKGEGTGAVRHMFSNHILKPERMPIEANVWGTPKSSGSFTNLFQSRIVRACDYQRAPFEVSLESGKKFLARPFKAQVKTKFPSHGKFEPGTIYLSCGSSHSTQLPDNCVDCVVTDPPFFDNVHYSELADFFFSWQKLEARGFLKCDETTRQENEVQDTDALSFAEKLAAVFRECHRLIKPGGLLVFSYHHSRADGWSSVARAICDAGFSVVASQPVKAEMSVATPKAQAKEPIQIDVLMVCRKVEDDNRKLRELSVVTDICLASARNKCARLENAGFKLSINDRRVIFLSEFLAAAGKPNSSDELLELMQQAEGVLENAILSYATLKSVS
jgi:putative DNA methylase